MTRIRQILINLVGNALKFTPSGSVSISVDHANHPSTETDDPKPGFQSVSLHFTVRDTGIGIPADKLDRLFKSFSQVDSSTTRQYGGTGLGLAICQRLSSLMGGRTWVESEAGKGSAFHFTIVTGQTGAVANDNQSTGVRSSVAVIDTKVAVRHPLRILLTDDDAVNRKVGVALLKKLGYEPAVAKDGMEALARTGTKHVRSYLHGHDHARHGWTRNDPPHPRTLARRSASAHRCDDRRSPWKATAKNVWLWAWTIMFLNPFVSRTFSRLWSAPADAQTSALLGCSNGYSVAVCIVPRPASALRPVYFSSFPSAPSENQPPLPFRHADLRLRPGVKF